MKNYIAFAWSTEDEGGVGIRINDGKNLKSRRVEDIGEFDTAEELAAILIKDDPYYYDEDNAIVDAQKLIKDYNRNHDEEVY